MRTEKQALVLSSVAGLAAGLAGVAFAALSGSRAILLDGAYNLCFFVTALITLRIARLLQLPDDRRYPFGYLHFEPLINLVKGLLILGISLFALVDAGVSLFGGGNEISAGLALVYAAGAVVFCGLIAILLHHARRQFRSPLVDSDVANWTVNFAISLGILVAFCLNLLLSRGGHHELARLVDPLVVASVVILTLAVPVAMTWRPRPWTYKPRTNCGGRLSNAWRRNTHR